MGDEVTENADQLLQLGQQILDTLVAAYVPAGDDDHALALFPGQAVPDTLVQAGSTNVLRLSEWVAGSYDFPLELALAGGTSLATTVQSGPTLRSAYVTAVRFGVPAVAADAPSRPRLEALISDARRAIGSGADAVLDFTVDPEEFLEPGHVWNTFDTTITTHAEQSTTTTTPEHPRRVDPRLWKLRALPDEVVEDLPRRVRFRDRRLATSVEVQQARPEQLSVLRRALLQPAPEPGPEVVLASVAPEAESRAVLAPGALTLALRPELDIGLQTARLVAAAEPVGLVTSSARVRAVRSWAGRAVDPVPDRVWIPPQEVVAVDAGLAGELATVSLPDLESAPSTTTVTTADTALHVHLEHIAVTIVRRGTGTTSWWDPELLTDPDWYVPGMRAGDLVAAADDAGTTTCEPLRLLLVRNLSLTGTWNATASGLMSGVHYVGPFLMQLGSSSQTDSSQQTVVLGQGTQVIGMVCGPLAPVPPTTDPLLVPAAEPVTPAG